MFYWLMKYIFIGPLLRLLIPIKVTGAQNVPADGPAVLVGNHLSFIDSVLMPLVVPRRQVHFLAKSDYFTGKGIKGWFTRVFMRAAGQLPIDRSGGKRSEASLNTGLQVLQEGKLLGLYPEGTRSPDGKLYRGRTGVARTILVAQCPVVAVAMVNSQNLMPIGARFPKRVPIEIHFGAPMDFSRFSGLEGDRFVLRSITDEIMCELRELGGQTYADVYASKNHRRQIDQQQHHADRTAAASEQKVQESA